MEVWVIVERFTSRLRGKDWPKFSVLSIGFHFANCAQAPGSKVQVLQRSRVLGSFETGIGSQSISNSSKASLLPSPHALRRRAVSRARFESRKTRKFTETLLPAFGNERGAPHYRSWPVSKLGIPALGIR
jgi:hypothetical protein